MLALGMAFLSKPRLLMIDELSLGLAPVIVEQLLPLLRELRDQGTTIILVEQSVNVALTVAETAYFMEKGEIRFSGATAELLERPDLLRSVFLEGASKATGNGGAGRAPARAKAAATNGGSRSTASGAGAARCRRSTSPVPSAASAPSTTCRSSVAPGEIVGIIGPNGAGKTTLFDVISGFTPPTAGRSSSPATTSAASSPNQRALRGLGRSFQDARLFPAMTVDEALAVSLERFVTHAGTR